MTRDHVENRNVLRSRASTRIGESLFTPYATENQSKREAIEKSDNAFHASVPLSSLSVTTCAWQRWHVNSIACSVGSASRSRPALG